MRNDQRITEELVYHLWDEGYFLKENLQTTDNEQVRIISKGHRNVDSGPDFKGIMIEIDGQLRQGDFEIHRDLADWYAHHHHQDSAYNQVILHGVLWPPDFDIKTIREDGVAVPIVILSDFLNEPIGNIVKRLQSLSPTPEALLPTCPLSKLGETKIMLTVEAAGLTRLKLKAERFKEERSYCSWNQLLYQGMMEALGYSKNQRPFRRLAQRLPIEAIFREIRNKPTGQATTHVQALLFGAAGLLPSQTYATHADIGKDTQDYIAVLESLWRDTVHRIGITPMRTVEWQFFRLRPTNFPTRRLAGAAFLLVRFSSDGILETFLRTFEGLKDNWEGLISELEGLLVVEATGYWKTHYRFEEPQQVAGKIPTTLIGRDRARDMAINVILPVFLLYADETENGQLKSTIFDVYRRYPRLAANSITRLMEKQLFGEAVRKPEIINTAQKQQGLIHLYKNYCRNKQCAQCIPSESR